MIIAIGLINTGNWLTPDTKGWTLFLIAGGCSVIAWVGFINGYRGSSPAILAPFEYAALIGGAIAGYLIWGEVPDRWVLVGAATIISSGLYVVYREIGLRQTDA
jgi:drug/metabolite transporter (DMT)-like permease